MNTPSDFCYWLQGFFELKKTIDHREGASAETMQVIEDHLKLVFDKRTPDRGIGIKTPLVDLPPTDYSKLVDLISKNYTGPYGPITTITC